MSKMILFAWLGLGVLAAAETLALFNGKDLDGWAFDVIDDRTPGEDIWSVKDGILVCTGRPPAVMRTSEEYENYELVVEWAWKGKKPGNSGVLVHASTPREMFVWPKSIEVQLRHGDAGDFWTIGESLETQGKQEGRRFLRQVEDDPEKPVGEWNTLVVRCEGNTISVKVNGVTVNEARNVSTSRGAICVQAESAEIHFRKIELTPLDRKPAP